MIPVSLKKQASPYLVMFVFGCTLIIVGLLYIMQASEAKADRLTIRSGVVEYMD